MKKIFLLLAAVFVMMTCTAQDRTITLGSDTWYYQFGVNTAADTISAFDTLYYVQALTNKSMGLLYGIQTQITEVSGAARVAVSLQGKIHSGDSWTNITTVTYYGSDSDTTINFSQTGTAVFYRYLRILYDCNTTTQNVKINTAYVKLWHL